MKPKKKIPLALRRALRCCPHCKKMKMILIVKKGCCSRSCATKYNWMKKAFREKQMRYRTSQEHRAEMRQHTKRMHKEHPEYAQRSSERMNTNNPMKMRGVKKRALETKKALGILNVPPPIRGGNGQPATKAEQALNSVLKKPWVPQLTVALGDGQLPYKYAVDIGHPTKKIAIEADGASHLSLDRRAQDQRRDARLAAIGWRVLRFRNKQILQDLDSVLQTIKAACGSTISKSQGTHRTQSRAG
jgi:very-short-patch-repair endonuclease